MIFLSHAIELNSLCMSTCLVEPVKSSKILNWPFDYAILLKLRKLALEHDIMKQCQFNFKMHKIYYVNTFISNFQKKDNMHK